MNGSFVNAFACVCVLKRINERQRMKRKRERETEWQLLKSEVNSQVSKLTRGILDAAITSVTNDLNETTSKIFFSLYYLSLLRQMQNVFHSQPTSTFFRKIENETKK